MNMSRKLATSRHLESLRLECELLRQREKQFEKGGGGKGEGEEAEREKHETKYIK